MNARHTLRFFRVGALALSLCATVSVQIRIAGLETGAVSVGKTAENKTVRVVVLSCSSGTSKLGERAPANSSFLSVSGSVINKSASDRVNLPDVHNAFFLNVNDHGTVHLHPLSEDTADPFWGPIALAPGEERPIEMVFAVPAEPIEQLSLRYLGDKGPFTIHLLGEAPSPLPTDSLASAPTPTGRTSQSNRGKGGVPPSARIKLDDVRVDKPPAESTIDTSGSNPSLKLRIQEALNRGGYGELIVVVRDDAVAVVIGVSKGDSLTARVSDLNSEFPKLSRVEPHLIAVPPSGAVHPKHLKDWANAAIKAAGLVEVEARMRKPDEVILLGHVKNQEEEETALSIARIGPGIKQVINRLNFQPSKKED